MTVFVTTLLTLSGDGVPPYSARGARQTLEPIALAISLHRDVNGNMINMAPPQMQKYKSEISCNDQQAPAFNGLMPGAPITVNTIVELSYLTATSTPARMVAGSFQDGAYTFYQMILSCVLMHFSVDKDEWGATTGWKLDLEEA